MRNFLLDSFYSELMTPTKSSQAFSSGYFSPHIQILYELHSAFEKIVQIMQLCNNWKAIRLNTFRFRYIRQKGQTAKSIILLMKDMEKT